MSLHPLSVLNRRTGLTRRTAKRFTLCAVVGATTLTATAASAPDSGPPGPTAPAAVPAAMSAAAHVAPLAETGKRKTKAPKKKRLRFAKHSEAIVTIKSVKISRYVYRGGQRTIDRNRVAHYTGWPDTFTRAGHRGVYWLAAHNYGTYGPFHRLLRVKKGAYLTVRTRSGARFVYKVQRRSVVNTRIPRSVVWGKWGPVDGPPRAVLQTCKGSKRLLVFATLVSDPA